jgi:hypothetical protein
MMGMLLVASTLIIPKHDKTRHEDEHDHYDKGRRENDQTRGVDGGCLILIVAVFNVVCMVVLTQPWCIEEHDWITYYFNASPRKQWRIICIGAFSIRRIYIIQEYSEFKLYPNPTVPSDGTRTQTSYVIDKLKSGIQQWQENQGEVEWRQDEWANLPDLIGQMVKEAFEEQTALGWGQALRGCLSMKWHTAMVLYYQEANENRWEAVPLVGENGW